VPIPPESRGGERNDNQQRKEWPQFLSSSQSAPLR